MNDWPSRSPNSAPCASAWAGNPFAREKLRLLQRDHHAGDTVRAVELFGAGMAISLDLIFAAPGETLSQMVGRFGRRPGSLAGSRFHLWNDVRAGGRVLGPAASW